MTALMRNGRDRRSGKPVMGHAMLERVRMFGTRSADYIRASGHSGCIATEVILQATTGRIHDRTRTLRRKSDLLLHRGRRPYMTLFDRLLRVFAAMQQGPRVAISTYSITSSARARNDSGIVRPSALAVVRFTISSNLFDACTGSSRRAVTKH